MLLIDVLSSAVAPQKLFFGSVSCLLDSGCLGQYALTFAAPDELTEHLRMFHKDIHEHKSCQLISTTIGLNPKLQFYRVGLESFPTSSRQVIKM
ncbi:MAG: hypothetical protein WBF33_30240 [Candidatus Nitrosopolaris sp.]